MDDTKFSRTTCLKINQLNGSGCEKQLPYFQEIYKSICEESVQSQYCKSTTLEKSNGKSDISIQQTINSEDKVDNKMVQEDNNVNDGADEQMLGADDNEKLAEKRDEVKFIKGDHQNGDAKIDIGSVNGKETAQTFTGMTKEELMKYANDPFWVRLRWIFFIGFWAIWAGMLVGAIFIIIDAPKCAAPQPLPWYKKGLLAKFNSLDVGSNDEAVSLKLQATGAIYELPAALTYSVKDPEVEQKIKNIVSTYKDNINVILDITPNYVTKDSVLLKDALADETKRSAFIWIEKAEVPNNWLSIVNGSAWAEVQSGNYVLSQFGDGLYDLHMNDTVVKTELSETLKHLLKLGVKGFRFKNTKYFMLTKNIRDEVPLRDSTLIHNQYGFWSHTQTTFQEGLGDVLYEYLAVVKNVSADAFLSVADDIIRPENYKTKSGDLGIDIPIYGRFTHALSGSNGKKLHSELVKTLEPFMSNTWLQWNYGDITMDDNINPSAIGLFVSLLPGVPVVPADSGVFDNMAHSTYKQIELLRSSPSYMHGEFKIYDSSDLVAYSRIKSGNPGYFVVYNPTEFTHTGNFSNLELPTKMTVVAVSDNYNATDVHAKVSVDSLEVSSRSTIILTYVPVKSG
ncbi:4F2 cell-surface antigen heavy chain isoform X2 [Teleopsis dalmanni]|uniref:4F2 cell-surface antigen heavy chain isoform X2 n=1 Tax=Teleopsis dalmanni TaxID=139649 RepID=UPI0018CD31EE|nr:4F2 cell-surface antigen heavy chain isoform X2 [Teleopsis dalmanni]